MINSTNWTNQTINSTGYGSGLVRADSTSVLAGSTVVLANGQDTSTDAYKRGSLIIKSTDWTNS